MSKKFLTNIDLVQNELQNARIQNLASAPPNKEKGQIYYNTGANRLFYYDGTEWIGADASDAISQLDGNSIIGKINDGDTGARISVDRLSSNTINIGNTSIKLGANAVSNLDGITINSISLSKNTIGFSISGGTTSKTLIVEDNATIKTNSIELGNNKFLTLEGSLDVGESGKAGKVTITSSGNTSKKLTLSSNDLTLSGTGDELTINDSPTIQGTGIVTLGAGSDVSIFGDKSVTLFKDLTIGTTHGNSKAITLKTSQETGTNDVTAIFPKVDELILVGESTSQNLTNKTINGIKIESFAGTLGGRVLDISKASLIVGASNKEGKITIQSKDNNDRELTLSGSPTIGGNKEAVFLANLNIGDGSSNLGAVNIKSAGNSTTTIIGPNNGEAILVDGTMATTSQLHIQGTDEGTSNTTFHIGAGGVKLKTNSGDDGAELQVRNNADSEFANIRVRNLYVEGTQTILNTEELTIQDNIIALNSGVSKHEENTEAGIEVNRYKKVQGGEEQPVSLIFDESNGKWKAHQINQTDQSRQLLPVAFKYSEAFGDGTSTSFNISHNLNTKDLSVTIRENGANYAEVMADVYFTTDNYITIEVSTPPTQDQYKVTIIG